MGNFIFQDDITAEAKKYKSGKKVLILIIIIIQMTIRIIPIRILIFKKIKIILQQLQINHLTQTPKVDLQLVD